MHISCQHIYIIIYIIFNDLTILCYDIYMEYIHKIGLYPIFWINGQETYA